MRVLWITNFLFPEATSKLRGITELKSTGGWLLGAAEALSIQENVNLYVASFTPLVSEITVINGNKIIYFALPITDFTKKTKGYWRKIKAAINPDIVHIFGTECAYGLSYINECGSDNVVVSIQGLLSVCANFYYSGLSRSDILRNISIRDLLKGSIFRDKNKFQSEAKNEIQIIRNIKHIIGRTSWDKAHALAINPNLSYHFCNEILRSEFYNGDKWEYQNCRKHSIFLSQANYPIKGLHQVLKAMPIILRKYPDTIIRVAGDNILNKIWYKRTGYSLYIDKLIKKYNLNNKVLFLGNLNAEMMKREYLFSNVFICPSSIENSPNSLGEAQILGVPCVSSYVGGIPDMIPNIDCGRLYRFEEVEILAQIICDIFAHTSLENQNIMISTAKKRHDSYQNTETLISIYRNISNDTGEYK